MTAFLVLRIAVTDRERWQAYREAVVPLIERFGGVRMTGAGTAGMLEGREDGATLSIYAFPSTEAVRTFWDSPEYATVKQLRRGAAELEAWAVPVLAAGPA